MRKPLALAATLALMLALPLMSQASPPSGVTKAADLFAGKTTDVGDVFVWNDATNLYVEIDLAAGWCMTESHVAAAATLAGVPQTNGNPIPGQFPYGDTYSPCVATDTFTIPLAGLGTNPYVAVHAKVLHETAMWVYSDDGNTTVTATSALPTGNTLPFASADAWEPYSDTDPSVWDTGVGIGTFQYADWIWQSYRVQTPAIDETVTFERGFSVPGPVAPGSWMKVTTDDAYTASLNGTQVASDTWPNWPSVESASPFSPVLGPNTLVFVATNSNLSNGSGGTIDNNPGGLIYEARINYYDQSESAWAGTMKFPGKNWATYFQFDTVLEVAPLYDVTPSPGTTWSCTAGATDTSTPLANSSVTWAMAGSTVFVEVEVDGALANSTFDIWVEQNVGTCPPGTGTPSNPAGLSTDANGDGAASFSFTAVAGAHNFWLSMWTPAGPPYPGVGTQVLRTIAVTLP